MPSLGYYERLFAACSRMMPAQRLPRAGDRRVHGIATAAGCQLVAMCDLAVAAEPRASPSAASTSGCSAPRRASALSRNVGRKRIRDARHR